MPTPSTRRQSSDRQRNKDRDRNRNRSRDLDRNRDRDWEREREREREKERDEYPEKERTRLREKDRVRERDIDKERRSIRRQDGSPEPYRKRLQHKHTDSASRLLDDPDYSSNSPSPRKHRSARDSRGRRSERTEDTSTDPFTSRSGSSNPLSIDNLARLTAATHGTGWQSFRVRDQIDEFDEADHKRRQSEYEAEKRTQRKAKREPRSGDRRRRSSTRDVGQYGDDRDNPRSSQRRETSLDHPRERKERRRKEAEEKDGLRAAYSRRTSIYEDEVETKRVYQDIRAAPAPKTDRIRKEAKLVDAEYEFNEKKVYAKGREVSKDKKRRERVVTGPLLEKGDFKEAESVGTASRTLSNGWGFLANRGPQSTILSEGELEFRRKRRKKICIYLALVVIILLIAIPVGVTVSKKRTSLPESEAMKNSTTPSNSNLDGISKDSIPAGAKGTYLDPFTWYDTTDFNVTYTDDAVGGLSIMGLNSTWDDSVQANENVPALNVAFQYGTMPVRGINLGGWLSIEPFITPSLFSGYSSRENVVDEYTLTSKLGATNAATTLEKHYSSFVTKQTFADIRDAGFDHVRIPFSYWAVATYPGDPYVPRISWRYLLRGIEWARENGLRINLDLHGAPGSQNGWNHSGRQGVIGWLNGTDGALNAQRTLDIHGQLSTFFAQPRYKNVVTMYGLLNEPRMVAINTDSVLNWTKSAIELVQKNNITAIIVFGDGFMGLDNWQGKLQGYKNLLLDVHQYVIFNNDLIVMNHHDKMNFACGGWTAQMLRSENTATGYGPTMCGEWSQADTDCAPNLNNLGLGSRWEGTLNTGNASTSVLNPTCPTKNNPQCSCTNANADPSKYSAAYKEWLLDFAEAQMISFEKGWGWFYWTWVTESAPQWSWKAGRAAGILPNKVYDRTFTCNATLPDYAGMGLSETY